MSSETPDFMEYKKNKQKQADKDLDELLSSFKYWSIQHTNLREKVRAKHVFCEITGVSIEEVEGFPWKQLFEDWFLYDYVTIIGTRLFDMFIKEHAKKLSTAQMQLSGLLLAAPLMPCVKIRKEDSILTATTVETEEERGLRLHPDTIVPNDIDIFLCRYVHWWFQDKVISPIAPIEPPQKEIAAWRNRLNQKIEESQRIRFLKEYGIYWLKFGPRSSGSHALLERNTISDIIRKR